MPVYVLRGPATPQRPGWAVYLRLAVLALALAAALGVLLFIGLAFAMVGACVSIIAAVVYGVRRRWLGSSTSAPSEPSISQTEPATQADADGEVRVIKVDEIIVRH